MKLFVRNYVGNPIISSTQSSCTSQFRLREGTDSKNIRPMTDVEMIAFYSHVNWGDHISRA